MNKIIIAGIFSLFLLGGVLLDSPHALEAWSCNSGQCDGDGNGTLDGDNYCDSDGCRQCSTASCGNQDCPPPTCTVVSCPAASDICQGDSCSWTNSDCSTGTVWGTKCCNYCKGVSGYSNWSACVSHNSHGTSPIEYERCDGSCTDVPVDIYCNRTPTPTPSVTGPANCDKNASCGDFSVSVPYSSDPDGDNVAYNIRWDGGLAQNFGSWVASGMPPAPNAIANMWTSSGNKTAQVQACDDESGANQMCTAWSNPWNTRVLECNGVTATGDTKSRNCQPLDDTGLANYVLNPPGSSKLSGSTVLRTLVDNCDFGDSIKCESICDNQANTLCGQGTAYVYEPGPPPSCRPCTPNCCEKNTCKGQTCNNGCGITVSGDKTCRDENWKEVTPE